LAYLLTSTFDFGSIDILLALTFYLSSSSIKTLLLIGKLHSESDYSFYFRFNTFVESSLYNKCRLYFLLLSVTARCRYVLYSESFIFGWWVEFYEQ